MTPLNWLTWNAGGAILFRNILPEAASLTINRQFLRLLLQQKALGTYEFQVEAAQIRSSIMAHFEQYLDIKKDIGMDEILEKHNKHFSSIEECFTDDAEDDVSHMPKMWKWGIKKRVTVNWEYKNHYVTLAGSGEA